MIKLLAAAIMILAVFDVARADDPYAYLEPPAEYAHEYTGPLYLMTVHRHVIMVVCKTSQVACAKRKRGVCVVLIRDDIRANPEYYEAVEEHELAHCNGWRHSRRKRLVKNRYQK